MESSPFPLFRVIDVIEAISRGRTNIHNKILLYSPRWAHSFAHFSKLSTHHLICLKLSAAMRAPNALFLLFLPIALLIEEAVAPEQLQHAAGHESPTDVEGEMSEAEQAAFWKQDLGEAMDEQIAAWKNDGYA